MERQADKFHRVPFSVDRSLRLRYPTVSISGSDLACGAAKLYAGIYRPEEGSKERHPSTLVTKKIVLLRLPSDWWSESHC
jgi:hypothetical protein